MPSKERMTGKERMEALYRRELTDRVPIMHKGYAFCAKNVGYPVADIYENPKKSFEAQKYTFDQYGYDGGPFYTFMAYGAYEFGGEVQYPKDRAAFGPSVKTRPVLKPEDFDTLVLPDPKTAGCIPDAMEFAKLQADQGYEIAFICGTPFTHAANLCGAENFLKWTIRYPKQVHKALRLMTDHILGVAEYFISTFGKDKVLARAVGTTESNGLISARTFEKFALPYVTELNTKVLELGAKSVYIHMCGDHNKNLELWSKVPFGDPGVISIGSEVSLDDAAKYFPTHVIAGNIDPVIISHGTPEEVYEESKRLILKGKEILKGRFVFMAGCEVPPIAPPHNVYMMKKAIDDFGWYE